MPVVQANSIDCCPVTSLKMVKSAKATSKAIDNLEILKNKLTLSRKSGINLELLLLKFIKLIIFFSGHKAIAVCSSINRSFSLHCDRQAGRFADRSVFSQHHKRILSQANNSFRKPSVLNFKRFEKMGFGNAD